MYWLFREVLAPEAEILLKQILYQTLILRSFYSLPCFILFYDILRRQNN